MREEYRADLASVGQTLVAMAEGVRSAMRRATEALLAADQTGAEEVVYGDAEINAYRSQVEDKVYDLLARQAPVASDLRQVVTAIHVAADLERMGDLADHVAKTCLRRLPNSAVPDELVPVVRDMARVADRISGKIAEILQSTDAKRAAELERDDDEMDELNKQLFGLLLGTAWRHGVEAAIDGALLARWYERFADHAVNAGEQIVYLVTGEAPAQTA
ncbi:phosphate signaling complex protein PhoU [Rugosimonospora acidiphila]|uniref:Phosphate-specific transport system accessory protein PhoU n=1 Tax=Rugosimonospora acidiphila TaxID=556531 RepID=A0ABP9RI73_9ACTN